MKLYQFILVALILLIVSSCGRKEYTEKGIQEIKKEIDSLLYNPEAEEQFNWGGAEAYSNFRAYFHKSKLIFINEDYRYREPGEAFNRYYFKDGNMLYFVGRELTYMPDKQFKNVELMVDPDGNVIAYDFVINGQRTGLDNDDSKKIIDHARAIEKIVSERSKIIQK
ncbi:MAG: hypothetical protein MUE93_07370 [Ignavibacteriaceae bacterium]|jgi:hypothetical protein|nr:hypothetical protein [Ignavibacteriaceae bacterium]MCU0414838.1 hypothetical protein [Ignavibacteriaceae bacterium]